MEDQASMLKKSTRSGEVNVKFTNHFLKRGEEVERTKKQEVGKGDEG